PGGPGGPGGPGANGGSNGGLFGLTNSNCDIDEGRQILKIAADGNYNSRAYAQWRRAANVQVVPVRVCPPTRRQLAQILRQSGKVNALQGAVAGDPLIMASLDRTRYGVGDVFAVDSSGGRLTVYVY